jgi:hypothetical protein
MSELSEIEVALQEEQEQAKREFDLMDTRQAIQEQNKDK